MFKLISNRYLTIQIIQPTRCNSFTSLLLDVYVWLNMFRASPHPSSEAYNCTRSLWFYRWREAAGALLVMVWQTTTNNAPATSLQQLNQRLLVQLYAPDDGRGDVRSMLSHTQTSSNKLVKLLHLVLNYLNRMMMHGLANTKFDAVFVLQF